jgi:hypothetical protein
MVIALILAYFAIAIFAMFYSTVSYILFHKKETEDVISLLVENGHQELADEIKIAISQTGSRIPTRRWRKEDRLFRKAWKSFRHIQLSGSTKLMKLQRKYKNIWIASYITIGLLALPWIVIIPYLIFISMN